MEAVRPYDPQIRIGGVEYALVMADGPGVMTPHGLAPVYRWVAVMEPEYVAPRHVADACDEAFLINMEVERAERAAGWDPNP